jgi:hypothetical protein
LQQIVAQRSAVSKRNTDGDQTIMEHADTAPHAA